MSDLQAGGLSAGQNAPASSSAAGGGDAKPSSGPDWADTAADKLEWAVSLLRDKTTVPITKAARAVVFGIIAGTLAVAALLLVIIGLVRLIDVYLPFDPYARRVWVAYAGLGAIFLLAGVFCWSKRSPRQS